MNWKKFTQEPPTASGTYLISIFRTMEQGNIAFNYIGFYNAATGKWHKFDPFVDHDNIGEELDYQVIGWVSDLSVYIG